MKVSAAYQKLDLNIKFLNFWDIDFNVSYENVNTHYNSKHAIYPVLPLIVYWIDLARAFQNWTSNFEALWGQCDIKNKFYSKYNGNCIIWDCKLF